jgi:hypothetical protein
MRRDEAWNACNAFMESSKLGELLDTHRNVKVASFGHTHRKDFPKTTAFGSKIVICSPIGYKSEWKNDIFKDELEDYCSMIKISENGIKEV